VTPDQKCQIQDHQNKDKLSVCRILLLQRKLNWAAQNPRPRRMRAVGWIADLNRHIVVCRLTYS